MAASFKEGDKLYINPEKLLPLARFLPGAASGGGGKGKGGMNKSPGGPLPGVGAGAGAAGDEHKEAEQGDEDSGNLATPAAGT